MKVSNITSKKRMRGFMLVFIFIFACLIFRVGWIQFVNGSDLQIKAYKQQTRDRLISAKRGTIYDATGKVLAASASAETVTVEPKNIDSQDKEKVAKAISDTLEVDYDTVLAKLNKNTSIETVAKKIEKTKTDKLRAWMEEENITKGINIDEDTKRYYPFNSLASNVIGFCGVDNQGLEGLEKIYDDVLKGVSGKIVASKDASGKEIPSTSETYIDAQDGYSIVLTIDETVQSIAEKYLEQAVKENECSEGGTIIVMRPKTGDILAMATSNSYNLNTPSEPNTEELKAKWDSLSSTEKNNALQQMYRNKAVADTYEPGSTFKVFVAAMGLEEGLVETDTAGDFNCSGVVNVSGSKIRCWRYPRSHDSQSLRNALMNSCNPAFIALGQRIGTETFYKYLEAFGFTEKTGVELVGDTKGIFLKQNNVKSVELATYSFGQRFQVTPLQMANAACAIANGGTLMKPRIVKEIKDSSGNTVQTIEPEAYRKVISEETSKEVLDIMSSVVNDGGTGKNAKIDEYIIGGKTGTSEVGVNTNKYTASFLGIGPVSNPEIVVLVTLFDPKGEDGHGGGAIAAPVAKNVMSETLKHLEVQPDYTYNESTSQNVTVPEVRELTVEEAIKKIEDLGLRCEYNTSADKSTVKVTDQVPKPGVTIPSNGIVKIYSEDNTQQTTVVVPDLKGLSVYNATTTLKSKNLNIKVSGTGTAITQDPEAGSEVQEGTVVTVNFANLGSDVH